MNNLTNYLHLIITIMETIFVVIAAISAAYEILSRVVPTTKTWSIIGNILKVLNKISEALDRKK